VTCIEAAIQELKSHLREHLVWERNTVWRDKINMERKTQTVHLVDRDVVVWGPLQLARAQLFHGVFLVVATVVFTVLLCVDLFGQVEQNRCFAILVIASILWAGQASTFFLKDGSDTFLLRPCRYL